MIRVHLYGGGPSNFLVAHFLSKIGNIEIHLYEKTNLVGRKFLVAGKGGFNLSHQIEQDKLKELYSPKGFLNDALDSFTPSNLVDYLQEIGINTFVGSSNRIFPTNNFKPIDVLNAIKNNFHNVHYHINHEFVGFADNGVRIKNNDTISIVHADYHVFGFGGFSWKKTGSTGDWLPLFEDENIKTIPFGPANGGLEVKWSQRFKDNFAGTPIKNISITFNEKFRLGELLITNYGVEGNAVYPFTSQIYEYLTRGEYPKILIDLKPQWTKEKISLKFDELKGTTTDRLKQLKISNPKIQLIREFTTKDQWNDHKLIQKFVKNLPIEIISTRPIDECISSTGGISTSEVDENFQLKKKVNHFVVGEMVAWNTQTGGFLLQGCFSMGAKVGRYIKKEMENR